MQHSICCSRSGHTEPDPVLTLGSLSAKERGETLKENPVSTMSALADIPSIVAEDQRRPMQWQAEQ